MELFVKDFTKSSVLDGQHYSCNGTRKIAPWKIAPRTIAPNPNPTPNPKPNPGGNLLRGGGNLLGGNFTGGNFPVTSCNAGKV